ncbi:MAG TPA: single-stranded DNA-binding protein [Candidatus Woesebacteria bacterium]|nr:single-stranded DNA-binding protein [Candidatus Woesebacteria bacterium]
MSARSLNKVMLIGNLTRDPNLRYTPNGTAVASFGIATNRSWTPADGGDKQERVDFHNIVAWSKLAEICGQLLHKGDKVYVEGRIQTRDWKTESGEVRKVTEIIIDNMMLLSNKSGRPVEGDGEETPDATETATSTTTAPTAEPVPEVEVAEVEDVSDDIPF